MVGNCTYVVVLLSSVDAFPSTYHCLHTYTHPCTSIHTTTHLRTHLPTHHHVHTYLCTPPPHTVTVVRPTNRIIPGYSSASLALQVALTQGVPPGVVSRADLLLQVWFCLSFSVCVCVCV